MHELLLLYSFVDFCFHYNIVNIISYFYVEYLQKSTLSSSKWSSSDTIHLCQHVWTHSRMEFSAFRFSVLSHQFRQNVILSWFPLASRIEKKSLEAMYDEYDCCGRITVLCLYQIIPKKLWGLSGRIIMIQLLVLLQFWTFLSYYYSQTMHNSQVLFLIEHKTIW